MLTKISLISLLFLPISQGIKINPDAKVLYGNENNCTCPATVDYAKVKKSTQEWKTIRSEGVQPGTARYTLLISKMERRICSVVASYAKESGLDCVVKEKDLKDSNGLNVVDATKSICEKVK